MKVSIAFLPIAALVLLASPDNAPAQDPAKPAEPLPAYFEGPARALDGNTIELNGYQVRLFGIDAPEMGDARGPVARGALDALLAGAAEVACDVVDQDRHGRPVGRCRAGGRDLSEAMVLRGWAFAYRVFTSEYDAAEAEARREGRGFWKEQIRSEARIWIGQVLPTIIGAAIAGVIGLLTAYWLHHRETVTQRIIMASSIAAEVESNITRVEVDLSLDDKNIGWIAEQYAEDPLSREVYTAFLDRIGLFGGELGTRIMRFYWILGFANRAANIISTFAKDAAAEMKQVSDETASTAAKVSSTKDKLSTRDKQRIEALQERLQAMQRELEDNRRIYDAKLLEMLRSSLTLGPSLVAMLRRTETWPMGLLSHLDRRVKKSGDSKSTDRTEPK